MLLRSYVTRDCRAVEVTKQFPDVMFMVDHCGLPYKRDRDTMKLWREGINTHALMSKPT